jgi:hypothetical protein
MKVFKTPRFFMARVVATAEIILRFSRLPAPLAVKDQPAMLQFDVFAGATRFLIKMKRSKFEKAINKVNNYQSWKGTITGKLGIIIKDGFELLEPGIQVFEVAEETSANVSCHARSHTL